MADIGGIKLTSMAKPKESLKTGSPGKLSPDPWSYEHRISLDQDALSKMGVAGTPKVGDVFHVMGEGHVHSVNSNSSLEGKPSLSVGVQLRKMGMKPKTKGGALGAVNQGIKDAE
jgi:hypothetical protein